MQAEREFEMTRSTAEKNFSHLHFGVASSANFPEHLEAISFEQRRRGCWIGELLIVCVFEIVDRRYIRTFS